MSEAKGRNIVNVIIVDFRAADTFGELFVLALAGIGILTLLMARRQAADEAVLAEGAAASAATTARPMASSVPSPEPRGEEAGP